MKFHRDTIKLADLIIINNYYNKIIDDLSISELCASILKHNSNLANEATCCDNPHYEKFMLPALLNHLSDISNKDRKIEFISAWQKGINLYLENIINELIEERKAVYEEDEHGCAA